ncbi:MAG: hypothetical protein ACK5LL_03165 [Suipraeoptans sp.]
MKKEFRSRSTILLIEIIIAICFFAVSSAICLQIFVKSHTISDDSKALDFAVTQTTSIGELLKNNPEIKSSLSDYYSGLTKENDQYVLFFDKSYNPCDKSDYYYRIVIEEGYNDGTALFTITMNKVKTLNPLYSLEIVSYQQAHR